MTTKSIADLYAEIDPAELTTDQLLIYRLNEEVGALRDDVRAERKGRRTSIGVMEVAFVLAVYLGGLFATNVEHDRNQACLVRREGRQSTRDAIGVAVSVVADYAKVPDEDVGPLGEKVGDAVYDALPPPDC